MGPQPDRSTAPMPPEVPWAACHTACELLDEAACDASATCQTAYLDGEFWGCWEIALPTTAAGACGELDAVACATREDCQPNYYQADVLPGGPSGSDWEAPNTQFDFCGANRAGGPGSCYGEATCDESYPNCPAGTLPGLADGCYTGYCIPLAACEPPPSCDALAGEAACIARADCAPLYQACDPNELCDDGYKYWGCAGA